ncbi:MAG: hypothetical protein KatS3mg098_334 [Candidatus Parcubacteria bacterium]|nr:MAG: hypothetical protein KatS3mg098_334 [Candidatus Parcubacteria bacterium]
MIIFREFYSTARARYGWGKGEYKKYHSPPAVPRSGTGGGKRFRNSALVECQNRKIFFSLIEKILSGARLNKCLENFSVLFGGNEADAVRKRGAGLSPAGRQSEVGIRILFKIGSNFVQKTPPIFNFRVFEGSCLALASLGLGRNHDFIGIFEIKKQFLLQNLEVRFAEGEHPALPVKRAGLTNLFCSAFGGTQSGNLSREAGLTVQKRL